MAMDSLRLCGNGHGAGLKDVHSAALTSSGRETSIVAAPRTDLAAEDYEIKRLRTQVREHESTRADRPTSAFSPDPSKHTLHFADSA